MIKSNNENIVTISNETVFNYEVVKIDPAMLESHPILGELGFANNSDARYNEMMSYFRHYDRPVVIDKNKVILHWPDVQAAVANGVSEIDCYHSDMSRKHIMQFILMKHKYHRKSLTASYNSVKFYEDYLNNHSDGIALSNSMTGTLREKIAQLMYTSDSTIKRLMEVGRQKPEKLGLIEEGYTSFKEVADEIKAARLAANSAKRKAAKQAETTTKEPEEKEEYYVEGTNGGKPLEGNKHPKEEYYTEPTVQPSDEGVPVPPEQYYESQPDNDGEELDEKHEPKVSEADEKVAPKPTYEDFNCYFSSEGLGQVEINVSANIPTVIINGKELRNLSYQVVVDEKSTSGTAHSFVIHQPGKNAFCIQLTVENLSKAA